MSHSLGAPTHAAIIVRVPQSVPTNLTPNAKRMRAFVYSTQPSLFILSHQKRYWVIFVFQPKNNRPCAGFAVGLSL
jgi:hypothetical protein